MHSIMAKHVQRVGYIITGHFITKHCFTLQDKGSQYNMSDTEQQFMETSENGHEGEEDFNGAEPADETEAPNEGEAETEACVEETTALEGEGKGEGEDSQNGASEGEGGQINASKGEEDAG